MKNLGLLMSHLGAAVISLHLGFLYSLQQHDRLQSDCSTHRTPDSLIVERVAQRVTGNSTGTNGGGDSSPFFLPTLQDLIVGGARISRDQFHAAFPLGFPLGDNATNTNNQVLLLYQSPTSLPTNYAAWMNELETIFPDSPSFHEALEHCDMLRVVSMPMVTQDNIKLKHRNALTCTALVGQTEADYVYKWIQPDKDLPPMKDQKEDRNERRKLYFETASRYRFGGSMESNSVQTVPGNKITTTPALENLQSYLNVLPKALEQLRPIADKVAKAGSPTVRNNIIVMVTNFGHAELFINFCCAARRIGLDLDKVLLFATDSDTYELAQALGIATFYSEDVFASIPRDSSARYGDKQYGKIMMSKVYSVHLVSELGYNYLFQDVDIIPYSDRYLEWFVELSEKETDFDMFFQNDHNLRAEYSPFSTNSGCYYVKNNARTRYFLSDFIQRGDTITHAKSHQAALSGLLTEHLRLYGLRPKTLWGDNELLLIGWHFHRNPNDIMKKLFQSNKTSALSMHMNWNSHKDEKRPFLEQMGDWYLLEPCVGDRTLSDIELASGTQGNLVATCCSPTPLYRCHFKNKPSVLPCESNASHGPRTKKSFW